LLFSAELGRRLAGTGVTTYSLHPGVIASDIWRKVPAPLRFLMTLGMISTEEGARSSLRCSLAPELANETGLYYDERGNPTTPAPLGRDNALAAELWSRSEGWVRAA
jgi:hypothetical protein